jgi:hypothetical protein
LIWELNGCNNYHQVIECMSNEILLYRPRNGRAPITQNAVLKRPAWMINWGVKRKRKTKQSIQEI